MIRLSDIENAALGVPSLYHHQIHHFGKCTTPEDITVLLFGLILYEMAVGREYSLYSASKSAYPSDTPKDLQKVCPRRFLCSCLRNVDLQHAFCVCVCIE